jgi:hypothetical protein
MTYAVIWCENGGRECVGKLELTGSTILLSGTSEDPSDTRRELRRTDVADVYLERSAPAKNRWDPSLVLVTRAGDRVAIGSLEGLGALHELAEHVAEARGIAAARNQS